jgi:integrase
MTTAKGGGFLSFNKKQRIVPMSGELVRILHLYKNSPCFDARGGGFLFVKNNGLRRNKGAYWNVFNRILYDIGIKNTQNTQ